VSCDPGSAATVASPVPAATTIHNLTVTIPSALGGAALVGIFNAPAGTPILTCTIAAGQTSCTAGPSATVAAGTPIIFATTNTTVTSAAFSYRLATPGVTPAAALHAPAASIYEK
jgi:hypothetical protein